MFSGRSRRSSIASAKALKENSNFSRENQAFAGSHDKSLHRSRSMLDLRNDFERFPLRRSFSATHLQRNNARNFGQRASYDGSFSDFPSPAQSEWSIKTAPQMSTNDMNLQRDSYPPSSASLPAYPRQGLWRSASQPNIRSSLTKTGTYPQGILKRNDNSAADRTQTGRRRSSNSSYPPENQYTGREMSPQEHRYSKQVRVIKYAVLYSIYVFKISTEE